MRIAYIAQDRPDLSEAVKCLSQKMSNPREGHLSLLKRVARYLRHRPRMVLEYRKQDPRLARLLRVHVDSDWAGDLVSRRSTSGMVIKRGEHVVKHSATLQAVIGLSSAEAEYYALCKGACQALGTQAALADLRLECTIELYSDSSSARALASRRGLGKIRHVETRFLWLQERIARKHLNLRAVKGTDNVADLLTKALSEAKIRQYCEALGMRVP